MLSRSHVLRLAVPMLGAPILALGWPPSSEAHASIDIVASNWKFTPSKITAHVNDPTTLQLTSSEGVHGFVSPELGIPQTTILPGKTIPLTFTPKTVGTYVVHCSIMCGAGHEKMALEIDVVP